MPICAFQKTGRQYQITVNMVISFFTQGHYFCLVEKDFDIYNCQFKFNIGKLDPEISYWFGFTFPSLS